MNLMKYKALMDTRQDTFRRMNKAIPLRPSTFPSPSKCDVRCHSKSKTRQKGYTAQGHFYYYFYQCCILIG